MFEVHPAGLLLLYALLHSNSAYLWLQVAMHMRTPSCWTWLPAASPVQSG